LLAAVTPTLLTTLINCLYVSLDRTRVELR